MAEYQMWLPGTRLLHNQAFLSHYQALLSVFVNYAASEVCSMSLCLTHHKSGPQPSPPLGCHSSQGIEIEESGI